MISKEQVQHIAKLARLELGESEIEKMQKDLSSILDYFDLLKETEKDVIFSQEEIEANTLRQDEALAKDPELANKLIQLAPNSKDRFIKVKSIF